MNNEESSLPQQHEVTIESLSKQEKDDIRRCLLNVTRKPNQEAVRELVDDYEKLGEQLYKLGEQVIIDRFTQKPKNSSRLDICHITLLTVLGETAHKNKLKSLKKEQKAQAIAFLQELAQTLETYAAQFQPLLTKVNLLQSELSTVNRAAFLYLGITKIFLFSTISSAIAITLLIILQSSLDFIWGVGYLIFTGLWASFIGGISGSVIGGIVGGLLGASNGNGLGIFLFFAITILYIALSLSSALYISLTYSIFSVIAGCFIAVIVLATNAKNPEEYSKREMLLLILITLIAAVLISMIKNVVICLSLLGSVIGFVYLFIFTIKRLLNDAEQAFFQTSLGTLTGLSTITVGMALGVYTIIKHHHFLDVFNL
ncbi:MAG: hypothetical protein DSM107014_01980 [Gomphosphaeria aponina SAG 52.96 = DSM 107014]|uniref:DUF4203 domain-containing protein n=1 Tax=Gomphosphaeria aponina SAG 52.96 = DSM 107014 TaxID=1521640 RepID=A0A941GMU4_9CHRO|nr:hypothetical protein [Gomphosphaeria aponina SAG 52.96 = DSM 107014]